MVFVFPEEKQQCHLFSHFPGTLKFGFCWIDYPLVPPLFPGSSPFSHSAPWPTGGRPTVRVSSHGSCGELSGVSSEGGDRSAGAQTLPAGASTQPTPFLSLLASVSASVVFSTQQTPIHLTKPNPVSHCLPEGVSLPSDVLGSSTSQGQGLHFVGSILRANPSVPHSHRMECFVFGRKESQSH